MQDNEKRNENDGVYGMKYIPGEGGYKYSPYNGYYSPEEETENKSKQKKPLRGLKTALIALAVAGGVIITAAAGFAGLAIGKNMPRGDESVTTQPPEELYTPMGGNAVIYKDAGEIDYSSKLTDVIASVKPSVVEIVTEYVVEGSWYQNYTKSGAGSGVVIMKEEDTSVYYIVTNNHVIEGSNNMTVRLTDGSEYEASLVGTDIFSDIAIVRIEVEGDKTLSLATVADSSELLDGQEIFVIGNPLGTLGGSVSKGIISCTEREISVDGIDMTLLQIDAAVNPGNSGGALFDTAGRLVGVVNAKYSDESVEGLGFAIPVNRAVEAVESIYEYGYVRGIASLELNLKDQSYTTGSGTVTKPTQSGESSVSGAAKDKDGNEISFTFSNGDFINSVNGVAVTSTNQLLSELAKYEVGDKVELSVLRAVGSGGLWGRYEYEEYTLTVELTEYIPDYMVNS